MLIGIFCGAIYGGSITAILINTQALLLPQPQCWTVINSQSARRRGEDWAYLRWLPLEAGL
ncbi:MAG: hypothetical protein ACLR0U_28870 [Enterocloster clostridioformis]